MNNETNKFILDLIQETTTTKNINWVINNYQQIYFKFLHKEEDYRLSITTIDDYSNIVNGNPQLKCVLLISYDGENGWCPIWEYKTSNKDDIDFNLLIQLHKVASEYTDVKPIKIIDNFLENLIKEKNETN